MPNNSDVIVREYSDNKSAPLALSEADLKYLENPIFHPPGRPTFDVRRSVHQEGYYVENSSYAGVIQLADTRITFSTKVKTNLFYLLSFLKTESDLLFDPENLIEIKDGANFFDIIGRIFANELREIIRKGILRSYVRKHDDLRFLKGKINVKHQIHHQITGHPRIACEYDDLTFDNLENQIVLRATKELVRLIRFNEELREELVAAEFFLRNQVTLTSVSPADCDRIQFSRINQSYDTIIKLSKVIFQERFIRSTEKGETKGFNFIVNMNKVFEDFVTELITEVVEENKEMLKFEVAAQLPFRTLDEEGRLKIVPDMVLKCRSGNDVYAMIIDTKYKTQDANADYYQLISYALAIPSSELCCLVYPSEFIKESGLTINRNILKPDKIINFWIVGIDLMLDEQMSYQEFILRMKTQVFDKIFKPSLELLRSRFVC